MITDPLSNRRLRQMLDFGGRVLYQAYTKEPYTVKSERYV